jgi:hypothetical protein
MFLARERRLGKITGRKGSVRNNDGMKLIQLLGSSLDDRLEQPIVEMGR